MRKLWFLAAGILAASTLASCGGGGGGDEGNGGGGGAGGGAKPALTTSVRINGQPARAQSADQYAVEPGDTVEVTPSQSVAWTGSTSSAGVTAQGLATTPTRWNAQLVNTTTTPGTYTVKASAGTDAASTKSLRFLVAGGADARNGSYQAYATSGARFALALNFDAKTYSFSGSNNGDSDASGTFSADPTEPGTYVFNSSRVTSVANTARFRVAADTIVGAFPFTLMHKAPAVVAIRPFVATRALIRTQESLDGVYNRFGLGLTSTNDTSQILQMKISGGGTKLDLCSTISSIDACTTITKYTVVAGTTPETWQIVDGGGGIVGSFGVAPLGDGKVYLSAGRASSTGTGTDAVFRIGVSDKSTWQVGTGHGSATPGSWATVDLLGNNTSTREGIASDGAAVTTNITYNTVQGVQGMRQFSAGTTAYYAMQGAGLHAVIGANNVAQGTNGYLQINLMD